jgi:NitT/TauT family transport system substrate-binding protein
VIEQSPHDPPRQPPSPDAARIAGDALPPPPWTRRRFLRGASSVGLSAAGLALLAGCGSRGTPGGSLPADAPLETTTLRIAWPGNVCAAPMGVAEELLRAEGFADVRYLDTGIGRGIQGSLAEGQADLGQQYAPTFITEIDAGRPILMLAGLHAGCLTLFGSDRVRTMQDLKGKTVAVQGLSSPFHVFLATMLGYVGLDPSHDVTWLAASPDESLSLLAAGQIEAYMAGPPFEQELRAKGIGHELVNTSADRPWSQYFCCVLAANRDFVQRHPVAAKRALRAILKATDLCASEPERATRTVVERGQITNYDDSLRSLQQIPYGTWREYDPEDSVRFYALRLREAGLVQNAPDKILAQGTDWRFLNELKRELKG